ncbi:GAF domain-containing sensor histidine kinase [Glaciecola sp. MH2013]|uniref:sensor histidine kinase n=1 Tax=Glaciecola sp. MH2013 TaxID=2785524 RepID=UPI00189FE8E3|nr:GAF domain-containing sensor histidine kinase [Glaciecola sp. MH2013]MBF7071859.1 GAF domain-containing sensor histidine kinase [Glaciecola sp. MH2013]
MIKAQCTTNEEERIRTLDEYGILDSDQEAVFDSITKIATQLCNVPIALISLVDQRRQWFKSKVGLPASETDRDIAFCAHAILQDDILEIENALEDERFHDNPLVVGEPHIRFYAGAPLTAHNGSKLGTLCVISDKPHKLSNTQRELLKVLALDVVSKLELKRQAKALNNANRVQKRLIQSLEQSNQELEGISYKIANELSAPLDHIQHQLNSVISTIESEGSADVTKLSASNKMLSTLQKVIVDMLDNARLRTSYEHPEPVNLRDLVHKLASQFKWSKSFELDVQNIEVSVPKIPLSTVLSNLITNAIKHHHRDTGKVSITASDKDDSYIFVVRDDGPGLPANIAQNSYHLASTYSLLSNTGLGLATVNRIVEHYNGHMELTSLDNGGTQVSIQWAK